MTIRERITYAIDALKLNRDEVFKALNIDPSSFRGKKKDRGINSQTVENFLIQNPEISAEFIMREEGNVFKNCNLVTGEHGVQNNNAGDVINTLHNKAETVGGHMVTITTNNDLEKIINDEGITIQSQQAVAAELQQLVNDLSRDKEALRKEVDYKESIINSLHKTIHAKESAITAKDEVIASKDQLINHLTANKM